MPAFKLAYYFASPWKVLTRRPASMSQVLELSKYEYLAEKWAAEYLIPARVLESAVSGDKEIFLADLADQFDVTLDFMLFRLEVYQRGNAFGFCW